MKTPHVLFTLCVIVLSSFCLHAQLTLSSRLTEASEIREVLTYYFYGDVLKDLAHLRQAYHPDAHLFVMNMRTKRFDHIHVGQYLREIASTPAINQQRSLQVLSLEIDGKAALARTEIVHNGIGRRITDYLALLKIHGQWQIISRCSFIETATFGPDAGGKESERSLAELHRLAKIYLRGGDQVDLNAFNRALHFRAHIAYVDLRSNAYRAMSKDDFLHFYASLSGRDLRRKREVSNITVSGKIASIHLRSYYKPFKVSSTEYLIAAQVGGRWQIVQVTANRDLETFLASN